MSSTDFLVLQMVLQHLFLLNIMPFNIVYVARATEIYKKDHRYDTIGVP